jgi:hypothetical protein
VRLSVVVNIDRLILWASGVTDSDLGGNPDYEKKPAIFKPK